ncbi:hydantoinase/oxoprolinase family protein [Alphaproteobacteria bacterium]|nr:hydantoinase/oxoprolinase family protein [Alphaproteobacteria bacterium]
MSKNLIIGVDVGGTFTDVFILDETSSSVSVAKVPTTPKDQSIGFLNGILSKIDKLSNVATIIHGTTVATNALLERKGSKTGVITSKGFKDVLEMRRRDRPNTWGLWGEFKPVVPRDLRLEVKERVLADGTVREFVDIDEIKETAKKLLDEGCEALSVIFINSYANDENEKMAKDAIQDIWPNEHVTVSSEILPEIREFERASTSTLNAVLQPVLSHYLGTLEETLTKKGFFGQVLIVQSNGGVMSINNAKALPIKTALSGPAAGVIAASYIGVTAGYPNIVSCDMGGTSFDVSLISDGQSKLAAQTSIDFGMVVRSPMVEIITIGAGGGSIARVDAGGLLQVGPESAGSDPGPVCYGLGKTTPTVTDANVVLGRINPESPIGGRLERLDVDAAREAINFHVAKPLGIDVMDAAEAILKVANAKMASAIRLVSVERGHDPSIFAAMPFGGGGALHAGALIREVGLSCALVPRFPGITSALGCVIADMRHDQVQTINKTLDDLDIILLDEEIVRRRSEGHAVLDNAGGIFDSRVDQIELDMLYVGQTHTISVVLPVSIENGTSNVTKKVIQKAFDESYRLQFGRLLEGLGIKIMNVRVAVIGERPRFDLSVLAPLKNAKVENAIKEKRQTYINKNWVDITVYSRLDLPVGASIDGPAILEQPDTTIFLEQDATGVVDKFGNFRIVIKP